MSLSHIKSLILELEEETKMALRNAILRHLRVPVQTLGLNQSQIGFLGSIRSFSSHDDHLSREAVVDRVLDVVKSFPKVDPAKVSSIFIKFG